MLELSKRVLEAVSVDKALFSKELNKFLSWLSTNDILTLKTWCIENFGDKYATVIKEVFSQYL